MANLYAPCKNGAGHLAFTDYGDSEFVIVTAYKKRGSKMVVVGEYRVSKEELRTFATK